MFDPERAKQAAREANPAFDAALRRADEEKKLYLEPVIAYFARLEEEIHTMPIASRFRRDIPPNENYRGIGGGVPNPMFDGLTEAEYKRAQLLSDVASLKGQAITLIGGVEGLVMDMQATQQEG